MAYIYNQKKRLFHSIQISLKKILTEAFQTQETKSLKLILKPYPKKRNIITF